MPDDKPPTPDAPAPPAADELPEKFRGKSPGEIVKMYSDLESKLGELGPKAKIAERVSQYGDPEKVIEWALYGAQEYQRAQTRPAPAPTSPSPVTDLLQDWELLPPREQANRLKDLTASELKSFTQKLVEDTAKPYVEQVQSTIGNLTRQWDIYRKVMAATRANPHADPEALLQTMVKVATGNPDDLMALAMKMTTGDLDAEAKAKAMFEAWKNDEQIKRKNAEFAGVTGNQGPAWRTPDAPKSSEEAKSFVLKSLLEKGLLSPDQV